MVAWKRFIENNIFGMTNVALIPDPFGRFVYLSSRWQKYIAETGETSFLNGFPPRKSQRICSRYSFVSWYLHSEITRYIQMLCKWLIRSALAGGCVIKTEFVFPCGYAEASECSWFVISQQCSRLSSRTPAHFISVLLRIISSCDYVRTSYNISVFS